VNYLSEMRVLKKEQIRALYLNENGAVIWDEVAAIGKLSQAMVSPRDLLAPALEHSAAGIIIAHNHPTGSANPSNEDVELTVRLENAAELLNIDLWDHIVISQEGYYSFNEAGSIKVCRKYLKNR
jgi:DNA repair protein RadC